jgi:hypothetical protein
MRVGGLLERVSAVGAAAQATVPGVYAWGVTVAPGAWARGAPTLARAGAVAALVMLALGVFGERRWDGRTRAASLWGFVAACAVSWCAAPAGLSPVRMDASRGMAGVLGWALFAFVWAAPAVKTRDSEDRAPDAPAMRASQRTTRADVVYVAGGALVAALLESVGWRIAGAERALLGRFVGLAAGLAVIGASTEIALQRHAPRSVPSGARRLRRALAALVSLAILVLAGLLNTVLD